MNGFYVIRNWSVGRRMRALIHECGRPALTGIDVITCIMQQCLARVDRKVFLIIIFSLEKLPGLHSGDSTLIFSYKTNTVVKQTEHVEFRIVVEWRILCVDWWWCSGGFNLLEPVFVILCSWTDHRSKVGAMLPCYHHHDQQQRDYSRLTKQTQPVFIICHKTVKIMEEEASDHPGPNISFWAWK